MYTQPSYKNLPAYLVALSYVIGGALVLVKKLNTGLAVLDKAERGVLGERSVRALRAKIRNLDADTICKANALAEGRMNHATT